MTKSSMFAYGVCLMVAGLWVPTIGCVTEHYHDGSGGDEWSDDEWDDWFDDCLEDPNHDGAADPGPTDSPGPISSDGSCPSEADAIYVGRDPSTCETTAFSCGFGYEPFDGACGCGCREIGASTAPICPTEDGESVVYVSNESKLCDGINLTCPDGFAFFDSECGCGCTETPSSPSCPNPEDPMVHFLSGDPTWCASIEFECPPDCTAFSGSCGCGCIEP